ncbi:MAG: hypothetical protein ACRD2E_11160 [Terriglobales bacterium]
MRLFRRSSAALALLATLACGAAWALPAPAAKSPIVRTRLKVGEKAPNFTLLSDQWKPVTLRSELGRHSVLLAFYVLAFTPG